MEVSAFIFEQLKTQMAEQRAHDKDQHIEVARLLETQRQGYEAKLEAQRQGYEAKLEAQRQDYEARLETLRQEIKVHQQGTEQLKAEATLQARFEALHAAKLVNDEELQNLEDLIIDSLEELGGGRADGGKVISLLKLSERVPSNAAFARQLRRKYM
jgi:hypothetical protein